MRIVSEVGHGSTRINGDEESLTKLVVDVGLMRRLSGFAKLRLIVLRPWKFFGRLHTVMIRLPPDLLNSHRMEIPQNSPYLLRTIFSSISHRYEKRTMKSLAMDTGI